MFFTISKILDFLFTPFSWIMGLVILALFVRDQRKSRRLSGIAIILILFFSNAFIADEMVRLWEIPMTADNDIGPVYDIGIVLGGGMVQIDKHLDRLIFRSNTDRIFQAIELYKEGRIRKILLSGGAGSLFERDMLEAPLLKRLLLKIGIPENDILMDSLSDNTHENAVNSARLIAKTCPSGKFLLITSSMHMRRALACFNKQGLHCTPYPTNKITGNRNLNLNHLFIPDATSLFVYYGFFHEIFGQIAYKIMGYS